MSTQKWIKMSKRMPTEADLPVWVWDDSFTRWPAVFTIVPANCFQYWRPAAADIPAPPKEDDWRNREMEAFNNWWLTGRGIPNAQEAWHAALAYERAEVSKLLPPVRPLVSYGTGITAATDSVEAIRARCGGAK